MKTITINKQELENGLKELPHRRTHNRERLINEIALNMVAYFKERELTAIPRQHINELAVKMDIHTKRKERVITELINHMVNKGLIKEHIIKIPIYSFRKQQLGSLDYGSYCMMMTANGYKTELYKYTKFPFKKKVKTLKVNDSLKDSPEFDEIITRSDKPYNKQGVRLVCDKSFYRHLVTHQEKKVYTIL